jgi:glutamate dehydrogenase
LDFLFQSNTHHNAEMKEWVFVKSVYQPSPTLTGFKTSMSTNKSTPENAGAKQQAWVKTLRHEIVDKIDQQMSNLLASLPMAYFEGLSEDDQLAHLKALMAFKICDIKQEIMLRRPDGRKVTVISRENFAGFLAGLIKRLPDEGLLVGAKIFTSRDNEFIIDMFEFQPEGAYSNKRTAPDAKQSEIVAKVVELTGAPETGVQEFVARYHPENDILDSPEEIANQFTALQKVEHTNDIAVLWETNDPNQESLIPSERLYAKVTVSAGSETTRAIFQRAAEFFAEYNIDIDRAFCETIRLGDESHTNTVAISTFHISIEAQQFAHLHRQFGENYSLRFDGDFFRSRMATFMRVDEEVIEQNSVGRHSLMHHFGEARTAEMFCALARLTQLVLSFRSGVDVSREQVLRKMLSFETLTQQILNDFDARFDPKNSKQNPMTPPNVAAISDVKGRLIAETFFDVASRIERSNLYVRGRRTLTFRFDGEMFENAERGETPFAIFYVYGNGFDGFHVRFRDVARGGMRLIPTRNEEHHLFESSRVFEEAFRLASAQQLKNKDIAEGGAKAAVVLKPHMQVERAGRDFVDGLLDLITDVEGTTANDLEPIDQEYLYLGPDENVTNNLIEWIVERASKRGYAQSTTIMSSKPATGINHKQFGVTSEGVTVFLHRALLESGFDPSKDQFTVKLTGGPDGDVGGNEIKILIREYGENVKIVGIADGSGAAHDPDGMDHDELLRLVHEGLGIANFSKAKLGSAGRVVDLANDQEIAWRNNLHFSVASDVFVPAGGRPSTINEGNWEQFLDSNGVPVSKIIVEGANLFITDVARKQLSNHGVVIVKDSSANKCGVICSSLEIIAGMLLSEKEFLDLKTEYVAEVVGLLRSLAETEAISLFNEHKRQPDKTLPEISVAMSKEIIRVADVINESFDSWSKEDQELANTLIMQILPQTLVRTAGPQLLEKVPHVYRRQLVAAHLSSRIAYREGCQNIRSMRAGDIETMVRQHLQHEHDCLVMIERLKKSDLPDRDKIIAILEHSGARSQRELKL